MKKVIILLFIISLTRIYPIEEVISEISHSFVFNETKQQASGYIDTWRSNDILRFYSGKEISIFNSILDISGYLRSEVNERDIFDHPKVSESPLNLYHIPGNEYYFFFHRNLSQYSVCSIINQLDLNIRKGSEYWSKIEEYNRYRFSYTPELFNIENSSFYSEIKSGHEVLYNGDYLSKFILGIYGQDYRGYNIYANPWVEGVEGPGIGEWLEVATEKPRTLFYVLNGFVDPYRPHLYKMNSRVKDAVVTGKTVDGRELNQRVQFKDFVYFKTIQFSEPVISMRLTIESAYEGSKWQDTSISAILLSKTE